MLIGAGGPGTNRLLAQAGIERLLLLVGEFLQERLGLGVGGENTADRRQREGTEADRAFQSGQHVGTLVLSHERKQLLRLQFALDLLGQETIEELLRDRTQFVEALPQEQGALTG